MLRVAKEFEPRPEHRSRYDAMYGLFQDLHDRFQEPYNALARIP